MDRKTKRYFVRLLYLCLTIGLIIFIFNGSYKLVSLLLYTALSAVLILHYQIYLKAQKTNGKYLLVIALVIALCLQHFENSLFKGFYIILIVAYALFAFELPFSVPFSLIAIASRLALLIVGSSSLTAADFSKEISTFILPRSLIIILVLIGRYNNEINIRNKTLTESLQKKTLELEEALDRLSEYAAELEKTADIRAREKLMHELHDKLGHILSTASIGSQAATIMVDKDVPSAKARMELVTKQIQEAMKSLRQVISGSTAEQNVNDISFPESLKKLIHETEKHTGIPISHNLTGISVKEIEDLSPPKRILLYNALMEGLTNGIRHGSPSQFTFSLTSSEESIHFRLQNNGTGFQKITYGFGLSKMRDDAERFGGRLSVSGHNGFSLEIELPIIGDRNTEFTVNEKD